MCNYCRELYTGNVGDSIIRQYVGIGSAPDALMIETQLIDLYDIPYLQSVFWVGGDVVSSETEPISYCPCCGRKLVK